MNNRSFIIISIIIGIILQIIPMPSPVDLYRPDWLLLILIYWSMALPNRVSVGVAAFTGLVIDLLYGTSLGVHSFALSIPVYLVAANYQRLRNHSMLQQIMTILMLCVLYHLIVYWLQYWITGIEFSWLFLWPAVSSVLFWPWLFWLLRKFRRDLRVT
ncbi:rod shape-determining protein MreD [Glaciecola petra]|uniref:Rod shape-determining protein MreD n=1 Tax=Glaciecola petra TaxID=3075602 RepID=A0ABU2ZW46_9ALTE|nr:rod shape-determining protein MreD [Aestuariibacter sp. P117]MDT0595642.1 rod shape-determining protein MreD [Aestuariibacter sp. P117]